MVKICAICGEKFEAACNAQKYCSDECGLTRKLTRKRNRSEDEYIPTLCWGCAHSLDLKCPWMENCNPVEGWKAEPTKIRCAGGNGSYTIDSFHVISCPLFAKG